MSTISSIKVIENDHDIFKGKNYINKFCEFLSEYEMKIIRFQKKKKQSYYHMTLHSVNKNDHAVNTEKFFY